jgi:MFS family permease
MVSIAMSSFEFAGIISSPINANLISKIGRKTSLILGFILITVSTTFLGMLSLIEYTEWKTFYACAMITRFIQGYGDGLVITTSFSLIGQNFAEEKAKYFGLVEASLGFGLIIGPPVGSFLYGKFGYAWAFYAVSILMFFNIILCIILIPNKLNRATESNESIKARQSLLDAHDNVIQSR